MDQNGTVEETVPRAPARRGIAVLARSQMRNIAPFLTLIVLIVFFGLASPSFATLDNAGNILSQVAVTGIIAAGLTFVILCAEIDLSVASIANVTGIAVSENAVCGGGSVTEETADRDELADEPAVEGRHRFEVVTLAEGLDFAGQGGEGDRFREGAPVHDGRSDRSWR